jgi:hypothetical protein
MPVFIITAGMYVVAVNSALAVHRRACLSNLIQASQDIFNVTAHVSALQWVTVHLLLHTQRVDAHRY